jgi:UDP-N-acetylglucosamine--dolichyl-phosphate N-acetylglucosaminephosphotransferase
MIEMLEVLLVSFIVSLVTSLFLTKFSIPFFERNEIIAFDLHKKKRPKVANGGGIPVSISLLLGLMFFVAAQTFVFKVTNQLVYLFASLLSILLITLVGFFDDLNRSEVIRGETKIRKGLKQWQKPLFTLPAAIPLMVVNAGETTMGVPLIGTINFGIFYPLILIPLGVVGAANAVNLLAGFNGSEAGMGIVYCFSLGIYAFLHGEMVSAVIFFSALGALIGFLKYNWFPARILPGDSLTYCLGAVVAAGVIIGNMERAGIITMTPFIIEFFLKLRSKFNASCLGIVGKDEKLEPPYGKKIYSLTHVIMNLRRMEEKEVTVILILIQLIFSIIPFIRI